MSNIKYIADPIQSRMAHDIRVAKWTRGLPPLLSLCPNNLVLGVRLFYDSRARSTPSTAILGGNSLFSPPKIANAIARDISLDMQELYRQLCWALGLPIVGDVTLSKGESLDAPI